MAQNLANLTKIANFDQNRNEDNIYPNFLVFHNKFVDLNSLLNDLRFYFFSLGDFS